MIFGELKRWLNVLSRKTRGRAAVRQRVSPARPRLESLEGREVPAVMFVDNPGGYKLTNDQGVPGLHSGDTVTWNSGDGKSIKNLTFGKNAFTSIQAAVNAAKAGDTVRVGSGTFAENVTVNKQLILRGNQLGVDARARRGAETVVTGFGNNGQTPFNVTANNVTIDGFTVEGATNPNQFGYGIVLGAATSGTHVLDNIVQDNIAGLSLANNSARHQTVIEHNLFRSNNEPGSASGSAIYSDQYLTGGPLTGAVTNVLIKGNTFVNNVGDIATFSGAAINLSSTLPGSQSHIDITRNTFNGNGRALFALNLVDSSFTHNVVMNSQYVDSADLRLGEGVTRFTVTKNFLTGNGTDLFGMHISDWGTGAPAASKITFKQNSISGYGSADLEIDSGAYYGTLHATGNWWGAKTKAGVAAKIVADAGQVDFTKFQV
jgi:hypothetical protein